MVTWVQREAGSEWGSRVFVGVENRLRVFSRGSGREKRQERASERQARLSYAARNGGEKGKDGHVLRACSAKDHLS